MKTDVPLQLRIGGMVLLILGPVLALFAGGLFLQAKQTENWPTVEGRVLQSEVEVSKKASGFRRSTTLYQDYYTAAIQYEYVVNGERFTGNRIALDSSQSSGFDRVDAERWVRKHPAGAALTVHYSPRDAKRAVIDPSADTLGMILLGGFGVLAIPIGLVLRRAGRQMQPMEPPAAPFRPRVAVPPAGPGVASAPRPVDVAVPPATVESAPPQPILAEVLPPQPLAAELASPRPSAAAPANQLAIRTRDRAKVPRPTHWLIRVIAIPTGLVLFLVGGLALFVAIKLALNPEDDVQIHIAIRLVVNLIMIGIMAGITLLGAFLFWKGVKKTARSSAK